MNGSHPPVGVTWWECWELMKGWTYDATWDPAFSDIDVEQAAGYIRAAEPTQPDPSTRLSAVASICSISNILDTHDEAFGAIHGIIHQNPADNLLLWKV